MKGPVSRAEQELLLYDKEIECLTRNTSYPPGYCSRIWDGIMCWEGTAPGVTAVQPCPDYFMGFDPQGEASKKCLVEGSWFVHSHENSTWTNFTDCFSGESFTVIIPFQKNDSSPGLIIQEYIPVVKTMSLVGYSVSLVTLIAAVCILASFKRLRCPRNTLHAHLFLSFMMRASLSLLKHSVLYQGLTLHSEIASRDGNLYVNHSQLNWSCKLLTSLWQYFIIANYSWLLMEGLYLHNLIFLALFSDTSAITSYIVLGWTAPLLFVVTWVVLRATQDDSYCWTMNDKSHIFLVIKAPIITSVVVNFCLFLNIVRVLHLKLTASISEEQRRFRRWAKSTLVLVPLFGVHYIFFIWLPSFDLSPQLELAWLFSDQLFTSFQGFVVAVLYCFLNGEVRGEVVKKWRNFWSRGLNKQRLSGSAVTSIRTRLFNPRRMSARQSNNSTVVDTSMLSFMSSVPNERRLTHSQITDVTQNETSVIKLSQ